MWKQISNRTFAFMVCLVLVAPFVSANWNSLGNCQVTTNCSIQALATDPSTHLPLTGATCTIDIRNTTSAVLTAEPMTEAGSGFYQFGFVPNNTGLYPSVMTCTANLTTDASFVANNGGEDNMLGMIIILPLLLAALLMAGAATLSKEHVVLRVLAYIVCFPLFFASGNIAVNSLMLLYGVTESSTTLLLTIRWSGILFFIIVSYFAIYLLWRMFEAMAQKKRQKDEY